MEGFLKEMAHSSHLFGMMTNGDQDDFEEVSRNEAYKIYNSIKFIELMESLNMKFLFFLLRNAEKYKDKFSSPSRIFGLLRNLLSNIP